MTCPLQLATGVQPDLSHLHTFGASAWSRLTAQERPDKLSENGTKGQFVGLARGYQGSKLLIRDKAMLQQAKLGIKPVVHIHAYAKLGIDMKVDDAALYRIGRKLLMQLRSAANQDAAPDSYPRKAPEPVREADPSPGSEQAARGSTPSDEGGGGVDGLRQRSSEGAVQTVQANSAQAAQGVSQAAARRLAVEYKAVDTHGECTHLSCHRVRDHVQHTWIRWVGGVLLHRRDSDYHATW